MYVSIPRSISSRRMYSSAEWERLDSPGPIFIVVNGDMLWFDVVGEPNGSSPRVSPLLTIGWLISICEEESLVDLSFTEQRTFLLMLSRSSLLE